MHSDLSKQVVSPVMRCSVLLTCRQKRFYDSVFPYSYSEVEYLNWQVNVPQLSKVSPTHPSFIISLVGLTLDDAVPATSSFEAVHLSTKIPIGPIPSAVRDNYNLLHIVKLSVKYHV